MAQPYGLTAEESRTSQDTGRGNRGPRASVHGVHVSFAFWELTSSYLTNNSPLLDPALHNTQRGQNTSEWVKHVHIKAQLRLPGPDKSHRVASRSESANSPLTVLLPRQRDRTNCACKPTHKHTVFSQCSLTCESIENRVESAVSGKSRRPRVRTREKHKTPAVGPAGVSLLLLIFFSLNGLP